MGSFYMCFSEALLWNGKHSARCSVSNRWLLSCKTLSINFVWTNIVLCLSHWIMKYDHHHHHHHGLYNDQYQLLHFWHLAASEMHKESDLFPKMHRLTLRYVHKIHLQYRIQDTKENTKCAHHEILLECTNMLECNQEPMQSYPDQMHGASSTAKTVQRWHWPNMTLIFIVAIYFVSASQCDS